MFAEKKIDMPWRKVYEARAALGWAGAFAATVVLGTRLQAPAAPMMAVGISTFAMALLRLADSWTLWETKLAMTGRQIDKIKDTELDKKMAANTGPDGKLNALWLGKGFVWDNAASQKAYDMKRYDLRDFLPPKWFTRLFGGLADVEDQKNQPLYWLHGVGGEGRYQDVNIGMDWFEGHLALYGSPGTGKTRLFELLLYQVIRSGDIVIMIDPKNDVDLEKRIERETIRSGRADAYYRFRQAYLEDGVRLDFLKNYINETGIASRLAPLIPSEGETDSFKQFCFKELNRIAKALISIQDDVSLVKIRRYIQGSIDQLLDRAMIRHLQSVHSDWASAAQPYIEQARKGAYAQYPKGSTPELVGRVEYYLCEVQRDFPSEVVDGLIATLRHPDEHYMKMILALDGVLDVLTSGALGPALSPSYEDVSDTREIMDIKRVIENGGVLYMGLDDLSDSVVSQMIASLALSDTASVAGSMYNFGRPNDKRVWLFIDEASRSTNTSFIDLAARGRGAGFRMVVATQSYSDFVSALGSDDRARSAIGNFNNTICLRVNEASTMEFVTEKLGTSYVKSMRYGLSNGGSSDRGVMEFSGQESVAMSESLEEKVPKDLLAKIPKFEYFATFANGQTTKVVFPMIENTEIVSAVQ